MNTTLRALLWAGWRASFNDGWRFGRAKPAVWRALLHLLLAGLALWRVETWPPLFSTGALVLLCLVEAGIAAFLTLFLRGRERLYTGPLVTLIHLSPTPARDFILFEVVGTVPGRAWTALLFALALWPALPAGARWWGAPALWLAALLGGILGHLTGLVGLIRLVRRWPAALVAVPALAMVLLLGFIYVAVLALALGAPTGAPSTAAAGQAFGGGPGWLSATAAAAESALALLLALPGVLLLQGLLRGRGPGPETYREGWLGLMERIGRGSRARRSRWPRVARGPAGALQALAWLLAMRNWFSLVRLGLLALGLVLPLFISEGLQGLTGAKPFLVFVGAGLATAFFNYGEQAGALFSVDGERAALPLLAAVRPLQWLWGKWLAAAPLPLVAAATTLVWALAGGMPPAGALELGGVSLAIAVGSVTWLVGAAAFDAAPRAAVFHMANEQMAAAFEQVPTRPGGVVGFLGAAALAAAGAWLWVTAPGWLAPVFAAPLVSALAGWWRLNRLVRTGVE